MKALDCILTIVAPVAIEDALIVALLEHDDTVSGFTTAYVEGLGQTVRTYGAAELVRGRARRLQVQIAMNLEEAVALTGLLRQRFPNPEIACWIAPLHSFGRFA